MNRPGLNITRLTKFVQQMTVVVREHEGYEERLLERGKSCLAELVANDDWLPDYCAQPHPDHYQQFLLHCDPEERFSVVSFVWGPGQKTPVHDHTVWGLIGMLRGREVSRRFEVQGRGLVASGEQVLEAGQVDMVSPTIGDIHSVANGHDDRVSISIHVYGANIGKVKRHVFDVSTGHKKQFVSGYGNTTLPNLWAGESSPDQTVQ